MYRAPNFGVQLANQQVQSSIAGILAADPATDSSKIKIADPNSDNKNSYLEGADAFNQIISKSSLGKVSLGYGIPNYFAQLEESNETGSGSDHGNNNTTTDPTNVSSGARREIAIKSLLKAEEAAIYEQRISLLRATNMVSDHSFLMFNFEKPLEQSNKNLYVGGTISGFLAGLLGTGGAIRGITLAAFHLPKNIFIATSAVIDLGVDSSRAMVYLYNGYFDKKYIILIPFLILISVLGSAVGKWVLQRTSEKAFRYLVLLLIMATSVLQSIHYFST
jgi:hypothetical protein